MELLIALNCELLDIEFNVLKENSGFEGSWIPMKHTGAGYLEQRQEFIPTAWCGV